MDCDIDGHPIDLPQKLKKHRKKSMKKNQRRPHMEDSIFLPLKQLKSALEEPHIKECGTMFVLN
jgi:hypothetical protein